MASSGSWPSGQFTTIFTLPPQNPDRFFYGDYFTGLVEGSDGFLYVTVRGSNENPNPMVFKIGKSGSAYQVVLKEAPSALSAASDGNLYGSDGSGIFPLTTTGTYTLLSSGDGFTVESLNRQATDGNFYGTCYSSWYHVCRVTTSGQVTSIFEYPNVWVADPPQDSVYSISTSGKLLQTVSFSPQPNAEAHPQLLLQAASGIVYGTTGEPNPAYNDYGSVFSINAGLPPG